MTARFYIDSHQINQNGADKTIEPVIYIDDPGEDADHLAPSADKDTLEKCNHVDILDYEGNLVGAIKYEPNFTRNGAHVWVELYEGYEVFDAPMDTTGEPEKFAD